MLRRSWYRTLRSAEVGPGAIVPATAGRARVLVARLQNGRAVAFAPRCPHQDTDLGDATVVGGNIRCPRHEYLYDAVTGENVYPAREEGPEKLWKIKPGYLPVWAVEERDGWIWVGPRPLPPPPTFDPAREERPVGAEVVEEDEADAAAETRGGVEMVRILRVAVGTTFEIRLPTNPLPGHTWEIDVGRRLEIIEEGLLPSDPPRWRVRLSAHKEGEDEVRCAFRQPWDVEPAERRRYVVRIVPPAG